MREGARSIVPLLTKRATGVEYADKKLNDVTYCNLLYLLATKRNTMKVCQNLFTFTMYVKTLLLYLW